MTKNGYVFHAERLTGGASSNLDDGYQKLMLLLYWPKGKKKVPLASYPSFSKFLLVEEPGRVFARLGFFQ